MNKTLATIETALADLKQGKMVVLVDNEDRENEGDLIFPATMVTPEKINFMIKYCRGLVCLAMSGTDLDRLEIPLMAAHHSKYRPAFTYSIEAAQGVSTGISAADRAHTIKVAINPNSKPADVVVPGHVFPLRARDEGVLARAGHTEGSVDLMRLAGLQSAAVICEIMNDDGSMARFTDLQAFAEQHQINMVSIDDLIAYRLAKEKLVKEVACSHLPLSSYGDFNIKVFVNTVDNTQHVALVNGAIDSETPCLVRVHSECLTGDIFGSDRCDCGWQLQSALKQIGKEGGVFLYLRKQEGRGIGLANKIKAYALQENGYDTVEANHELGFAADHRDYGIGSQILRELGVRKMRLLTNNPQKIYGLQGYGLDVVSREPIEMQPTPQNQDYLRTKKTKLGHLLAIED